MRSVQSILLMFLLMLPALSYAQAEQRELDLPKLREIPTQRAPSGQLIDYKRKKDKALASRPLSLVPHKPTYLIGSYYLRSPQSEPFEAQFPDADVDIDPVELKFQFSIKTLILSNLLGQTGDLWAAYTNRSFWQAFNAERSSPFRETNHEPEFWLEFATDRQFGPLRFKGTSLGMVHQSNGQWGTVSRSWNRIYSLFVFQKENLYFALKPWWRIPEASSNDDNPDIGKYLGNFEFYALKEWQGQTLSIMLRNNLRLSKENHGAVQLDYTFPLFNQLRGYLQVFSGYGESLIDYDHEVHSLGFGLMLSNWL